MHQSGDAKPQGPTSDISLESLNTIITTAIGSGARVEAERIDIHQIATVLHQSLSGIIRAQQVNRIDNVEKMVVETLQDKPLKVSLTESQVKAIAKALHDDIQKIIRLPLGIALTGLTPNEIKRFTFIGTMVPPAKERKETPSVWHLPNKNDEFFTKRSDLIEKINVKFQETSGEVVILQGLGGSGKTQLAIYYTHHAKKSYSLRAWFSAESKNELMVQYRDFCQVCNINIEMSSTDNQVIDTLHYWLSKNPGWLLVYDNVNDDISPYVPNEGGDVLVTLRHAKLGLKENIVVSVFTEQEAKDFSKLQFATYDPAKVETLIKKLGFFPLAMAQAAAYLKKCSNIEEYLTLYEECKSDMLTMHSLGSEYHSSVLKTWLITFKKITIESNEPLELLYKLSYLSPEQMPKQLLYLRPLQVKKLNEMLGILKEYSMINLHEKNCMISMHRLVQEVLQQIIKNPGLASSKQSSTSLNPKQKIKKQGLDASEQFITYLNPIVDRFIKLYPMKDNKTEEEVQLARQLQPHLESVIHHLETLLEKKEDAIISKLELSKSQSNLLILLGDFYDVISENSKQAEIYFLRALSLKEAIYKKDSPGLARIYIRLGSIKKKLQEYNAARIYYEKSLKSKNSVSQEDSSEGEISDLEWGYIYENLGEIYQDKFKDADKAKTAFEESLKFYDKVDHKEKAQIVKFRLQNLGQVHDGVYVGNDFSSDLYYDQSDAGLSAIYQPILNDCRAKNSIASVKKALDFHETELKKCVTFFKKMNSGHYGIVIGYQYLGLAYEILSKNVTEENDFYNLAFNFYTKSYSACNIFRDKSYFNMRHSLEALKQIYQARSSSNELLSVIDKLKSLGESSSSKVKESTVDERFEEEKNAKCELIQLKTQPEKLYPELVESYTKLGVINQHVGRFKATIEHYEKALKINQGIFGQFHPNIARSYNSLGDVYQATRDFEIAIEYYKKALAINHKLLVMLARSCEKLFMFVKDTFKERKPKTQKDELSLTIRHIKEARVIYQKLGYKKDESRMWEAGAYFTARRKSFDSGALSISVTSSTPADNEEEKAAFRTITVCGDGNCAFYCIGIGLMENIVDGGLTLNAQTHNSFLRMFGQTVLKLGSAATIDETLKWIKDNYHNRYNLQTYERLNEPLRQLTSSLVRAQWSAGLNVSQSIFDYVMTLVIQAKEQKSDMVNEETFSAFVTASDLLKEGAFGKALQEQLLVAKILGAIDSTAWKKHILGWLASTQSRDLYLSAVVNSLWASETIELPLLAHYFDISVYVDNRSIHTLTGDREIRLVKKGGHYDYQTYPFSCFKEHTLKIK